MREEIADTVSESLWLGEIESVLVRVCDFEDCEVDESDWDIDDVNDITLD